jgi:hypothetical protein
MDTQQLHRQLLLCLRGISLARRLIRAYEEATSPERPDILAQISSITTRLDSLNWPIQLPELPEHHWLQVQQLTDQVAAGLEEITHFLARQQDQ